MGVKFGEIDAAQILDNEFRIGVLERVLDALITKNPSITNISLAELEEIRVEVANFLSKKYPNSGIRYEPKSSNS